MRNSPLLVVDVEADTVVPLPVTVILVKCLGQSRVLFPLGIGAVPVKVVIERGALDTDKEQTTGTEMFASPWGIIDEDVSTASVDSDLLAIGQDALEDLYQTPQSEVLLLGHNSSPWVMSLV